MTDYAKIALNAVLSENSDYSNPRLKLETTQTLTPTAFSSQKIAANTSGSTLIDYSPTPFNTITAVAIVNLDAANFVTVQYLALPSVTSAITNPGSTGFTFTASDNSITDNTSGSKFANAAAGFYIHNNNASSTSNRAKNMLITEKVSAHKIKVATSLTDSSNDTAVSFNLNVFNQQRISAGGIAVIPGNLLHDTVSVGANTFSEMAIVADTKEVSCNVIIFGT